MKLLKYLIVFIPFIISCSQINSANLPECISKVTEQEPSIDVHVQEVNGENHYWIKTTEVNNDNEFIFNEQCDTVCLFPIGFIYLSCLEDYTGDWELVRP